MKSIAFFALTASILTGAFAQATPACPDIYTAVYVCGNTKVKMDGYEKVPQVKAKEFVLCMRAEGAPTSVFVTAKPMLPQMEAVLMGADDSMWGRNGFGVNVNKAQTLAAIVQPMQGSAWRVFLGDARNNDGSSLAASEFNCKNQIAIPAQQ
jgi:hypothetical protein